jgi:hypothetical protein
MEQLVPPVYRVKLEQLVLQAFKATLEQQVQVD